MRAKEFLIERATAVLFHYTSTGAALKILKSGQFELASITGNKSEENYAEGKLHGRCTYFYPGGIIANRIVNYKNGLMEGNYQNFNRKGSLISETNYKKNRKNGDVKIYSKRTR